MPFKAVFYVADVEQDSIVGIDFFTSADCGFSFTDAAFTLEGEEIKCVDQDSSLCITTCQAQQDTLLKLGK